MSGTPDHLWRPQLTREDQQRVLDAWKPCLRAASHYDLRFLLAALEEIAAHPATPDDAKRDPLNWLVSRITCYAASYHARTFPVSLWFWLRDQRWLQTDDQWKRFEHDGHTGTTHDRGQQTAPADAPAAGHRRPTGPTKAPAAERRRVRREAEYENGTIRVPTADLGGGGAG